MRDASAPSSKGERPALTHERECAIAQNGIAPTQRLAQRLGILHGDAIDMRNTSPGFDARLNARPGQGAVPSPPRGRGVGVRGSQDLGEGVR